MEEEVILQVLNKLDNINVTSEDINVCHSIPTRIHDSKSVHVVKFISRKKKIDILRVKKTLDFQHEGNQIFINEHLLANNRRHFLNAMMKKQQLNYKFLWTRNGFVYMRKAENSPIIFINKDVSLSNLT